MVKKKDTRIEKDENDEDLVNLSNVPIKPIEPVNPVTPFHRPTPRPSAPPKPLSLSKSVAEVGGLDNALASINKRFGEGSIMKMGEAKHMKVEVISTGVITIDAALGVGGIPRGRVIECFGPESGGKTSLVLHLIAETQKRGGRAAFIDAEHALDPGYAKALGVNVDEMYINQPSCGEEALDIVEALARSGAFQIIAVDSVAALVPRKELEGDMGDSTMGVHAKLMSQAMRKLTAVASQHGCTIVFINQIREKIGVMYGSNETTTGGRALRFFASIRMEIRRVETLKDASGQETGNKVKVKIVKNKVAPPFRVGEGEIWFGEGFRKEASILDLAVTKGIVVRSGAWYSYGDERIGQGSAKATAYLMENPEVCDSIEAALRKDLFGE